MLIRMLNVEHQPFEDCGRRRGDQGSSKKAFSLPRFLISSRRLCEAQRGWSAVEVKRWLLAGLLRPMLLSVNFDEEYYRKANRHDLAEAERSGTIASLHEHYLEFGYFEHRLPWFFVQVDITFYRRRPGHGELDLSESSARLAQNHFERHGFKEVDPERGLVFSPI